MNKTFILFIFNMLISSAIFSTEQSNFIDKQISIMKNGKLNEYLIAEEELIEYFSSRKIPKLNSEKGDIFKDTILMIIKMKIRNPNVFKEFENYERIGLIKFGRYPLPLNPECKYNNQ